MQYSFH